MTLRDRGLDGYVFLNQREEKETAEWLRKHDNKIPSMDNGSTISGEPIVYGLVEDPKTGRLAIPKEGRRIKWRPEDLEAFRFLSDRERKILEMHLNKKSQRQIAEAVAMTQQGVCKSIARTKNKLRLYRATIRKLSAA